MPSFSFWHTPALLVGTALAYGGLIPFWNPEGAIREFGLPEAVAKSKPAHTCFIISGARISALGVAVWIFYLQDKLDAVDIILALLGYVGAVDAYACLRESMTGMAVFRGLAGLVIGAWGVLGLTSSG